MPELDENEVIEKADFADKRDLAKEFDTSVENVEELLSDQGFSTLKDFSDEKEVQKTLDLNYEIKELEKRKLQSIFR
ncbi:MAG: hypothetical protein R6V35_04600 [Candidatus Nanohaloarchaea archaeon]